MPVTLPFPGRGVVVGSGSNRGSLYPSVTSRNRPSGAAPPQRRPPAGVVIFLDVDGVLHSLYGDDLFKESCLALFERIVRATNASIVLSSSWRTDAGKVAIINNVLQERNLPLVIDCTKDLKIPREAEICEWLDRHHGVARWIAIDDMDLQSKPTPCAQRLQGHFVRTHHEEGLVPYDAELAIRLLATQSLAPSMSRVGISASPRLETLPAHLLDRAVGIPTSVQREFQAGRGSPCGMRPRLEGTPTSAQSEFHAGRGSPCGERPRLEGTQTEGRPTLVRMFSDARPLCRSTSRLERHDTDAAGLRLPKAGLNRPHRLQTCALVQNTFMPDTSPRVRFRRNPRWMGCAQEAVRPRVPMTPELAPVSGLYSLGGAVPA